MHFKLDLPHPMRTYWPCILWNAWRSLFSQPDLFYFIQQLDTTSRTWKAGGLCAMQMPNYHTHTQGKKKKGKKQKKTKPHHAIHFCSIFMTLSCFCIKYKETEKNLIEENSIQKVLKVQWQVTYPRSEKNWLYFVFETGKKTDCSLNLFIFSTFSKSFASLFIADWNLFLMHSLYLKQPPCVRWLPFYKKASVLMVL